MAIYKSINRAKLTTESASFVATYRALNSALNSSQDSIVDSIGTMSRDTPKGEFIVSASAATIEAIYPAFDAVLNIPNATIGAEPLAFVATQAHIARINGEKHALGATFRISARYTSRTAYKMGYKPVAVTTAIIGKNGDINNAMFALAQILDDFANALFTTANVPDALIDEFTATCQAVVEFNDGINSPEPVAEPVADAPTKAKTKPKAVADAPTKA